MSRIYEKVLGFLLSENSRLLRLGATPLEELVIRKFIGDHEMDFRYGDEGVFAKLCDELFSEQIKQSKALGEAQSVKRHLGAFYPMLPDGALPKSAEEFFRLAGLSEEKISKALKFLKCQETISREAFESGIAILILS